MDFILFDGLDDSRLKKKKKKNFILWKLVSRKH